MAPPIWTHNIPNESPRLIVVSIVFMVISTVTVAARFAWRWYHLQRGFDDVMALCAYGILLIQTIFGGVAAHYGFGKQRGDIQPTFNEAMKYFYLYQICYKLLGGFTKLTFCFLYLRIFNQKRFHYLVWAIATVVATGSIAFAIATVFQCTPVHRAWDRRVPGFCTSNIRFWFSHAAFNTFFDIVVYVLPIPMIRTLKLARGQKTGLISIFSLGAFVIAASIVRMVMLRGSAHTDDPTWGSMEALVWTEVEANCSVVICCLPALRVPFVNIWHWIKEGGHRPETPPQMMRAPPPETAWSGPHRSSAEAHPSQSKHSWASQHKGKHRSGHSRSSGSKTADSWYERVLLSLSKEKEVLCERGSIHEEDDMGLTKAPTEEGLPSNMELGMIYKRTEVHVSSTNVEKEPDIGRERHISMQDFLGDGK